MSEPTPGPRIRVRVETHFGLRRLYPADPAVAKLVEEISGRKTLYNPSTDKLNGSAWLDLLKLLGVEVVEVEGDG